MEVTTSPRIAPPPYSHAALLSYDFGWPRTGLSSAMSLGNWDSLCSSSGVSSSSAWALGLGPCMKWVGAAKFFNPTHAYMHEVTILVLNKM